MSRQILLRRKRVLQLLHDRHYTIERDASRDLRPRRERKNRRVRLFHYDASFKLCTCYKSNLLKKSVIFCSSDLGFVRLVPPSNQFRQRTTILVRTRCCAPLLLISCQPRAPDPPPSPHKQCPPIMYRSLLSSSSASLILIHVACSLSSIVIDLLRQPLRP